MDLNEARKRIPQLAGFDDQTTFELIRKNYYPDADPNELAKQLNYTPKPIGGPEQKAGVFRTLGDVGIKLAQGGVGLGSSIVGVASLATGGLAGKGMRAIGYDPKATNEMLGEYLSDSQKNAEKNVSQSDGFVDAVVNYAENPRAILGGVAESAPGMLGGMGVARMAATKLAAKAALATPEGAAAYASRLAAGKSIPQATASALETQAGKLAANKALDAAAPRLVALGSATEGAQTAGQIADDAQGNGRAYSDYVLPALGAGLTTAAIGTASGRLFGDAETALATGAKGAGIKGDNFLKRGAKGVLVEGLAEEAPQSYMEQVYTNAANGEQDLTKGASAAAGAGFAIGGAQGGAMAMLQGKNKVPETGPLSRAANSGIDAHNQRLQEQSANAAIQPEPQVQPQELNAQQAQAFTQEPLIAQPNNATVAPQSLSDDNQIALSERSPAYPLEHAQAMREKGRADGVNYTVIPHLSGEGYTLAPDNWLSDEDRARYASLQTQPVTQPNATAVAEGAPNTSNDLEAQLADVDARVQGARAEESKLVRNALLDEFLQSPNIEQLPPEAIRRAFESTLAREGYNQAQALPEEIEKVQRFTDLRDAQVPAPVQDTPAVVRGTPNEMPADLVKELRPVEKAPAVAVEPLPAALVPLAAKAKNKTEFWKALNQAKIPQGDRAALMAAFKAYKNDPLSSTPQEQVESVNSEIVDSKAQEIHAQAHEAATSPLNELAQPSAAQKEAGNYKKGHINVHGLDISIENPQGSVRSGVDKDGTAWENTLPHHYGYIKGTVGADKDHIDTFIGDHPSSNQVFIIDQVHPDTGKFDEHKIMLGFNSANEAKAAYQASYAQGWTGGKNITETTIDGFKEWLNSGKTKKPFAKIVTKKAVEVKVAATEAEPTALNAQKVNSKFIKDMTDDELRFGLENLPKRSDKIRKEMEKRGLLNESEKTTEKQVSESVQNEIVLWENSEPIIFNSGGGEISVVYAYVIQPSTYEEIYKKSGGILNFELRGSGVDSHTGFKSVSGVIYSGVMNDERLLALSERIAKEHTKEKAKEKPVPAGLKKARELKAERESKAEQQPKSIGENQDGKQLMQDERGVRYYVENGVRLSEPVSLRPTKEGIETSVTNRRDEFKTVEELRSEKTNSNNEKVVGDEGYTLLDARNDLMELRTRYEAEGRIGDDRLLSKIRQYERLVKNMEAEQNQSAPAKEDYRAGLGDGFSDREKELYAKAHDVDQPGDVMLQKLKFVSFEDAKAAARQAITDGVLRNVPFQYSEVLDIAGRDVHRLVDAMAKEFAPKEKTKKELAAEKVSSGLAELFAKLGDGTQARMMPEQRRNLMPILTQVFEGAVEMGYESFKDAAKYVLGEMRKLGGNGFADQFNLGELKGAYNSLSPSEENEIAATKVRTIDEIDAHSFAPEVITTEGAISNDVLVQPKTEEDAKTGPQNISRRLSDINVKTTVYDAQTGEASMQEMPADQALSKIDERMETLKALMKCMGA